MYIGILLSVHYSIGGRSYVVITYMITYMCVCLPVPEELNQRGSLLNIVIRPISIRNNHVISVSHFRVSRVSHRIRRQSSLRRRLCHQQSGSSRSSRQPGQHPTAGQSASASLSLTSARARQRTSYQIWSTLSDALVGI